MWLWVELIERPHPPLTSKMLPEPTPRQRRSWLRAIQTRGTDIAFGVDQSSVRDEYREKTFLIESSREFLFIQDELYGTQIAQMAAEFNVKLTNGDWHKWHWTLSPGFKEKLEQEWEDNQEVGGSTVVL